MQLFQKRNHLSGTLNLQGWGCDTVTWTWKQLQNAHHLKLTCRCMPFSVWWGTKGGSSKGLHTLNKHSANISPGKEPAGSQSGCHLQKMPWRFLKCWSMHVWQPLFWLLLTTLNHSCWRLMHPRMDWGQCCHRSRQMGSTTPLPIAAGPSHLMRRTTTQLSSSF